MALKLLGKTGEFPPLERPLLLTAVQAGFPSPADDYVARGLDLNEHLVRNPDATFYWRVAGDSMRDAGIGDGDILVVDRAREPRPGSIVVAFVDGEYTCKRFEVRKGQAFLAPANPDYPAIPVTPERDVEVWGVVAHCIKSFP